MHSNELSTRNTAPDGLKRIIRSLLKLGYYDACEILIGKYRIYAGLPLRKRWCDMKPKVWFVTAALASVFAHIASAVLEFRA